MFTLSNTQPHMVKRSLRCLESVHSSQSGALVALLIETFLCSHQLAVSRLTNNIVCNRLEDLLGESPQVKKKSLFIKFHVYQALLSMSFRHCENYRKH